MMFLVGCKSKEVKRWMYNFEGDAMQRMVEFCIIYETCWYRGMGRTLILTGASLELAPAFPAVVERRANREAKYFMVENGWYNVCCNIRYTQTRWWFNINMSMNNERLIKAYATHIHTLKRAREWGSPDILWWWTVVNVKTLVNTWVGWSGRRNKLVDDPAKW